MPSTVFCTASARSFVGVFQPCFQRLILSPDTSLSVETVSCVLPSAINASNFLRSCFGLQIVSVAAC
jgi:hypothetical protein